MTDTQILFLGFVLVATAIVAVAGAQLAPADSSGIVPRKGRYNWGAGAAVATVVNLGVLFDSLGLKQGAPTGGRIGGVGIGVMCAVLVALLAYIMHSDERRGPRWQKTGGAFTAAMVVLAVVARVLA